VALLDHPSASGYLFLAVIAGHILLISAQVNSRSGVPVLESVTFGVFSEVQRGCRAAVRRAQRLDGYVGLRHVKAENDELKRSSPRAESRCRSSARWPIGRAGSRSCSSCASSSTLRPTAARDHRRGGDAGFPDA
jgi:hypothetical protein